MKTRDGFEVVPGLKVWNEHAEPYIIVRPYHQGDYEDEYGKQENYISGEACSFWYACKPGDTNTTLPLTMEEVYGEEKNALQVEAGYWLHQLNQLEDTRQEYETSYNKTINRLIGFETH